MVSTRLMSTTNNSNANDGPSHSGNSKCNRSNQAHTSATETVVTISILDLPQEILEKVMGYLTFKNVCSLRLVSVLK